MRERLIIQGVVRSARDSRASVRSNGRPSESAQVTSPGPTVAVHTCCLYQPRWRGSYLRQRVKSPGAPRSSIEDL